MPGLHRASIVSISILINAKQANGRDRSPAITNPHYRLVEAASSGWIERGVFLTNSARPVRRVN
jgi:hypothetical protein